MSSFDTLDHAHLRRFLQRRVRDGVLLRLIGKWLNAGVLEEGGIAHPGAGTPQGGVVSPLLSNVYLHYVLDTWFDDDVKPRMEGQAFLVRYADDFVMGFSCEEDARRVLAVLPKRFGKYGLTLHEEKTRLVPFQRPPRHSPPRTIEAAAQPGTFDFLGFTHYWGRSRKGGWVIKRKTATDRLSRALQSISRWCRFNRHLALEEQRCRLAQRMHGHYAYYGITGNYDALHRLWYEVRRTWKKWLSRRSQRGHLDWEQMLRLLSQYQLPRPVVVHSVYRAQRNQEPRSRMR